MSDADYQGVGLGIQKQRVKSLDFNKGTKIKKQKLDTFNLQSSFLHSIHEIYDTVTKFIVTSCLNFM
jgi:hypothetical protein